MTKEEIESFLKEVQTAKFCSINKDGSMHAAPVSYKYESGQIIAMTPEANSNVRNVNATRSSRARRSSCRAFCQDLPIMEVRDLIKFVLFDDSLKLTLSARCGHTCW
jgi:hypothetical protein